MRPPFIALILALVAAGGARAQDDSLVSAPAVETEPALDRSGWGGVPIVYYSPETHLGLGGFVVHFFRLLDEPVETRTSSVSLIAFYTTRGQGVVELMPELYLDDERWHLWSRFDVRAFPDSFWGIGRDAPDAAEERFDQTTWRGELRLRRRVAERIYAGVAYRALHADVGATDGNGPFSAPDVIGEDGSRTAGGALTVGWDDRDQTVDTRRGGSHELALWAFDPALGGEHRFARLEIDLRQFVPLGRTHTLGVQLRGTFQAGEIPFHQMAALGGPRLGRGWFEGRWRDENAIAAQIEYRFPIWWRLRGAAFASAGEIAARPYRFDLEHVKWAAGGGLRFLINEQERLAARIDVGVGPGTWGAYFTASEAF